MKLSPQKKYLLDLYGDGDWHCSTDIHFVRDFRKRISEMNAAGYVFKSIACDGRCRTKHSANIHMYRLESGPPEPPKPVTYVRHPVTGERITTDEFARL